MKLSNHGLSKSIMDRFNVLNGEIGAYVINLYNQYQGDELKYHNLEHTKSVVKRALEIAINYPCSEADLFILSTSAWFHDTGHLTGDPQLHEDRSVNIMKEFMNGKEVTDDIVDKVERCISATKLPQRPKTLLDEIMCDADTFHFGTKAFLKTDRLLRKELELRGLLIDNWEEKTLELLLSHRFFTTYCNALLTKGKNENIAVVRQLLINKNKNQ